MNRDDMPAACVDRCDSCKAECVWVITYTGKRALAELVPDPAGNLALSVSGGQVHANVVPAKLAFGRRDLHLSHFVKCPQSNKWRNSRHRWSP